MRRGRPSAVSGCARTRLVHRSVRESLEARPRRRHAGHHGDEHRPPPGRRIATGNGSRRHDERELPRGSPTAPRPPSATSSRCSRSVGPRRGSRARPRPAHGHAARAGARPARHPDHRRRGDPASRSWSSSGGGARRRGPARCRRHRRRAGGRLRRRRPLRPPGGASRRPGPGQHRRRTRPRARRAGVRRPSATPRDPRATDGATRPRRAPGRCDRSTAASRPTTRCSEHCAARRRWTAEPRPTRCRVRPPRPGSFPVDPRPAPRVRRTRHPRRRGRTHAAPGAPWSASCRDSGRSSTAVPASSGPRHRRVGGRRAAPPTTSDRSGSPRNRNGPGSPRGEPGPSAVLRGDQYPRLGAKLPSSRRFFTATRYREASAPSMIRWSYDSAR